MLFRPQIIQFSFGPDAPAQVLNLTARNLYNTQDNLSAVINFLANSIAQLPLKVYRRDAEDKRARDRDSVAAKLLWRPNSDQTEYEFIRALATEYFLFGCVYTWAIPDADSESGYQLRIIPTEWVTTTEKENSYGPQSIMVTASSYGTVEIPRTEFVRFCTYSPGNPGGYVSPISALRQTLEEQIQAGRFRKELWRSSGRLNAQIVRPKDVQPWSPQTKEKWLTAFREAWGADGSRAGSIPLMEDGMEIKTFNASFKEQQWVESVKLSRESVAAAYRINPSLVWHSDTQTYASSKDNARALYAECLGPDLQMIQQRINSFLLPMIGADPGTYVEFDLTEKLKGSFEERASILQASVGGPWLTRNEARRDNNLPPIEGGDELLMPLNLGTGGEPEPLMNAKPVPDWQLKCSCRKHVKAKPDEEEETEVSGKASEKEQDAVADVFDKFFKRQKKSVIPKIGADSAEWWNGERWNKELADDLEPVMGDIATAHGETVATAIGIVYNAEITVNYIRKTAEARAEAINNQTKKKIQTAIDEYDEDEEEEDIEDVIGNEFDKRSSVDAALLGAMIAKTMAGWGSEESVRQANEAGTRKMVYKEWVTGANARPEHAAMDGERVLIDELFSNGADWPGDDSLDPDESCGCNCTTRIIIIEE
jgi:HK97 family phage portal protein